ncbi:MAG: PEP-CTERM sorting domain-containing protein [Leptospirillum sp.]
MFTGILTAHPQVANATPIDQISGSGTWTTIEPSVLEYSVNSAPLCTYCITATGNWSFSFDLPNTIASNPTFQATNFNFNGGIGGITLENTSGTSYTPYGLINYTGGIAFGSQSFNNDTFSMMTCIPGCNTTGSPFGADLVEITGPNFLSGTNVLIGNTLTQGNFSIGILLDGGLGIGSGSLTISNLSATPEPPTFWLMATGILGMFGWVGFRRGKAFLLRI